MKTFQYTALDQNGQETTGSIEADSESDAINKLRGQQLYPTKISLPGQEARAREAIKAKVRMFAPEPASSRPGCNFRLMSLRRFGWRGILSLLASPFTRRRDTARDRRRLWELLGTLVHCGTPILAALNLCARAAGFSANRDLMLAVHKAVKGGESFVPPLEAAGISPCEIAMIGMGEETGQLPEVLKMMAQLPDENSLRGNPQVALSSFLPAMMEANVPLLRSLKMMESGYRRIGGRVFQVVGELAEAVERGATFSEALKRFPDFDAVFVGLVASGEQTGQLSETIRLVSVLPKERQLRKDPQLALVSFLAPVIACGVPLVPALKMLEFAYANLGGPVSRIAGSIAKDILGGDTFSEALSRHPEFDAPAISMVMAGELGGVLDIALSRIQEWMLSDYRRFGYAV